MQLTDNFNRAEFDCNDGTEVPEEYIANVQELADNLQVLRNVINCPIEINSGYRHPDYNAEVGGGKKSQHLTASAADIDCEEMPFTPKQLARIIKGLIRIGVMKEGGIGVYSDEDEWFVHYDIRGHKARWVG